MNLEDCLPPDLRGPATNVTRIAAGLSGAGVYRVEARGETFVLKVSADHEPPAEWARALHIQRLAADAGLSPRIIHVDQARRAVLTAFVADRSFPTFYRDPQGHQAAVALLGRTVRRVHELPIPDDVTRRDPHTFLTEVWGGLAAFTVPAFARQAIERALTAPPPAARPPVLSHNDLNPSNLIYDGAGIQILDWTTAAPMEPFYDLATLAVFLRMDEADCRALLSAYDGHTGELPPRFAYTRRLVAALAGTMSLYLAEKAKHPGGEAAEALSLGDFYQQMRAGSLRLGTPEGQWAFGLALLKESLAV
jgi:aminoglycoside phosphotransferase (APT) family kinase protein